MSELVYTGLPYTTMTNRRTPRTIYHIDADGIKNNYLKLASGEAISDLAVTKRMVSEELGKRIYQSGWYGSGTWDITAGSPDTAVFTPDVSESWTVDALIGWVLNIEDENWVIVDNDADSVTVNCEGSAIVDGSYYAGLFNDISILEIANASEGDILYSDGSQWVKLAKGTDTQVLTLEDGIPAWKDGGGGGDMPNAKIDRPSGSWDYPTANPAPLDTDTGTNGTIKRHLFDDTNEEFVESVFQVPLDLGTGDVTFEAYGYASTADATNNKIALTFYHKAISDSESWDQAYTAKASGDLVTDATQDDIDYFTWTETVANLEWTAGEFVRIKLSRTAPTGNELVGDWGLTHFRISIPRS
jgi:hypothetical protein